MRPLNSDAKPGPGETVTAVFSPSEIAGGNVRMGIPLQPRASLLEVLPGQWREGLVDPVSSGMIFKWYWYTFLLIPHFLTYPEPSGAGF